MSLSIVTGHPIQLGTIVLLKRGRQVWTGPLGSPIEDAVFDTILMHPEDMRQLHDHVTQWLLTPRSATHGI